MFVRRGHPQEWPLLFVMLLCSGDSLGERCRDVREVRAFHVLPVLIDRKSLSGAVRRGQCHIQLLRDDGVEKEVLFPVRRRDVIHLLLVIRILVVLPLLIYGCSLRRAWLPMMIEAKLSKLLAARGVHITPNHMLRRIVMNVR